MRTIRWCVAVGMVAFGVSATGEDRKGNKLPDAVLKALEKAGELEVYSLDGNTSEKDGWHGAKVLGKTTVKGDEVKKLVAAINKGVAEGDVGARCFIPRHGVRVTHDGKSHDLVICFECHWVYVYTDKEEKRQSFATSGAAHKPLNAILTAAKVPLAK